VSQPASFCAVSKHVSVAKTSLSRRVGADRPTSVYSCHRPLGGGDEHCRVVSGLAVARLIAQAEINTAKNAPSASAVARNACLSTFAAILKLDI